MTDIVRRLVNGIWTTEAADAGGGGGGSTPAGNDRAVQFNDNGAFGGDDAFVWDEAGGNGTIKLVTTANGTAGISGNGPGVQLQIAAGDGDATHVGGEVTILSGGSAGFSGGQLLIEAGTDSADGEGGAIAISSGHSVAGDGGDIAIRAHPSLQAGVDGGNVLIGGGWGVDNGGDIVLDSGAPDGAVRLFSGNNNLVELNNNGLFLPAAVDVSSLPGANPGPGLLWNDSGVLSIGT